MKSVLLATTNPYLSVPLVYLGTYLKSHDVNFEILNMGKIFSEHGFEKGANNFLIPFMENYDCTAFTCPTREYSLIVDCAYTYARSGGVNPIIIGGYHPSSIPEQSLTDAVITSKNGGKFPLIDIAVKGYGHETLLKLLDDKVKVEDISNIYYFNKDEGVVRSGDVVTKPPMFSPDWDLIKGDFSDIKVFESSEFLPVNYTYGCPNSCSYCNSIKQGYYSRDPYEVANEIDVNLKKYRVNGASFLDDNMFLQFSKARSLFEALKESGLEGISLCVAVDPSILARNKKRVRDLFDSYDFNYFLSFSLEFLDKEHIRKWNRNFCGSYRDARIEKEAVKDFIKGSPVDNFTFNTSFISPCPDDSFDEYMGLLKEAVKFSRLRKGIIDTIKVNSLSPYPGTESFNYCERNNLWKWTGVEKYEMFKHLKWGFFDNGMPYVMEERVRNAHDFFIQTFNELNKNKEYDKLKDYIDFRAVEAVIEKFG